MTCEASLSYGRGGKGKGMEGSKGKKDRGKFVTAPQIVLAVAIFKITIWCLRFQFLSCGQRERNREGERDVFLCLFTKDSGGRRFGPQAGSWRPRQTLTQILGCFQL